jgi:hypothetical protein
MQAGQPKNGRHANRRICLRGWLPECGDGRPSGSNTRSRSGRDVADGLERLDLFRHVVLHHIPRHVHQRVAEIDVDAHTGQTGVVVVLQARLLFRVVRGNPTRRSARGQDAYRATGWRTG